MFYSGTAESSAKNFQARGNISGSWASHFINDGYPISRIEIGNILFSERRCVALTVGGSKGSRDVCIF